MHSVHNINTIFSPTTSVGDLGGVDPVGMVEEEDWRRTHSIQRCQALRVTIWNGGGNQRTKALEAPFFQCISLMKLLSQMKLINDSPTHWLRKEWMFQHESLKISS